MLSPEHAVADSEIPGRVVDAGSLLGDLGQALLDAMPGPAYICDDHGAIITRNAAAEAWWGERMRSGMKGDAFLQPMPPWRNGGGGVAAQDAPLALARRTGSAVRDVEVTVDTMRGGHRSALASVVPLRDRRDAIRGFLCSFGTTESADDIEDLFENGTVGLHLVASDGTILRANRAELELLGYRRDEYVGHHIREFHVDQDVLADIVDRLRAGETIDRHPARLRARDGRIRHVQITSSACFRDGNFVHARCFTIDVTEQKRLADAARAREMLAHQLLQALPTAIYTTDAQGRITFYNEAAVEFAGRRPQLGEQWCVSWRMFRPDGTPLPHDQCPMAVAIRESRPIHGEEAIAERPDGSRVVFAAYPTPLRDDAGVMVGAVNMLVDITERKKIELSLQQLNDTLEQRVIERTHVAESAALDLRYSERNFSLLVGSIVDYAIFMLDPDGIISNWNAGAERIKGYRADEVVGRHFSCFYTPEDRARGLPANALAVARREGRYSAEGWRMRKDGSRFWASVVIDPVIDHGDVIGFAKVTRDVTERMESEAALVESESRARGVIDTALDGFVQLDEAGRVVEWNPRATAMFGWSRENAMGQPLTALIVADEDRARIAACLPPGRRAAAAGNEQIEAIDFEGNKIPVELSISTLVSKSGRRTNVFIRDLSEKIFIEAQLRQAQKMEAVGQLTGGLAHDFNNLLQGIIGSLDIIQLRVNEGRTADIGRFVGGALTSAYRAAAMTHRLLAFSRRQPLDPRPVDVNPLMISMEDLIQRTIGEQIKVMFEPADDLWLTLCDPNQLESAVLNLSINARDAMPEGGLLTLRSRNVDIDEVKAVRWQDAPAGQYVCVEVADTGTGMPPDVVERAFDPFFTTKPQGQGTGLGLSMVYGFCRQSNGHCDIRSVQGKGTTIRLYLPRHAAETGKHADKAPTPATPAAAAGRGEVVLVVEDEIVVRNVIVEVLHQLGYSALEAADAEAGLVLLRSGEPIDLLVSDVGLPGMNGRKLADEALGLCPDLKVLLMTGYASAAATANGFLAPGMELITKPFTVEALARRMREMIESTHR